jgi:hypothetical protein
MTPSEFAHAIAQNPSAVLDDLGWDDWCKLMIILAPGLIRSNRRMALTILICDRAEKLIGREHGKSTGEKVVNILTYLGLKIGEDDQ